MKVTLNWLKEFVDISYSPEELANALTMAGLEVESVEKIARPFSGVVIGHVLSCSKHPQADKLHICSVDSGASEPVIVVCGAPNAAAGITAPLALPGAELSQGLKVESREIRGVASSGMLCSEAELGLTERSEGLMILDSDAPIGADFSSYLGEDDYLFDVNITPNRPDCMSVIGLAREIAAISGKTLKKRAITLQGSPESLQDIIQVEIKDAKRCYRYSGRYLRHIHIQPSPFWMAYRLQNAGIRAINNVVDITNYVMLETGHPLHAFDYRHIAGKKIIVRTAASGESFTTLDSKSHTLDDETCLICDADKAVALAGIMGGLNSEVLEDTENVFLESAYFEPTTIRRSSKKLGISTESSKRFERGADPNGTLYAMNRAAQLMCDYARAEVVGDAIDVNAHPASPRIIQISLERVNSMLGTELSGKEILSLLPALEIQCRQEDADKFTLTIPTFRPDLERPIDIIEEIARLYGYDKIPFARRAWLDQSQTVNERIVFQDHLRTILAGLGLRETLSLSLVSPAAAEPFLPPGAKAVELLNPLSTEWSVFRSSLLISLLQNTAYNRNRQNPVQRFFEIGNAAWMHDDAHIEKKQVAAMVAGDIHQPAWYDKGRAFDFYDIKGILMQLLQACGIKAIQFKPAAENYWGQENSSLWLSENIYLGAFGRIDEALLAAYKIKTRDVFAFQLDFDTLYAHRLQHRVFDPIPRFPSVPFDIALLMDANIPVGDVEAAIWQEGGSYLISVQLFDFYQGEQIPAGKKSVAFSLTFCSRERTLGDEDITPVVTRILSHLHEKYGIELRPR